MIVDWMTYIFRKNIEMAAYLIDSDQSWLPYETRDVRYEIVIQP